jgi:hypothetical protein
MIVLGGMGSSHAGQGEADATDATPEALDLEGCSACTLRHQNLSRRRKEWQAVKEARGDCQIKGDITSEGERLYRRPGERDYEWAWISEAKGERWFCSVEEAEAAGWRAAE